MASLHQRAHEALNKADGEKRKFRMSSAKELLDQISLNHSPHAYQQENWTGTFDQYLDIVRATPQVTRTAHQRLYDMICQYGTYSVEDSAGSLGGRMRYAFFDDPENDGRDAIFGLTDTLTEIVNVFRSAALGYGAERRIILLHGPVGSSKSTIAKLIKRGVERYSRSDDGRLYSYGWKEDDGSVTWSPMNDDPLRLVHDQHRDEVSAYLNAGRDEDDPHRVTIAGDLNPLCRFMFKARMEKYNGDWTRVVQDVVVRRIVLSEQDRMGIGTFQPKAAKHQVSTELTGDTNSRKVAEYGSERDPRAFNFDGEFHVANRGLIEFSDVLKLDDALLYDLLGATQEHTIKPKGFAQTDIDTVIIGHTNDPEYRKLQSNESMDALRDRMIKIDVPYVTRLSDECKIYQNDYNSNRVPDKHIAPHTLEVAAMWAVLTRLEEPGNAELTRLQKLKLYDGKTRPGFTTADVVQLRKTARTEGMMGISPRYVQDRISSALVANSTTGSLSPLMVIKELENGLQHRPRLLNDESREAYSQLVRVIHEEYTDVVKNEVQRAIAADEESLVRLCGDYIDSVKAYTQQELAQDKPSSENEEPDEGLMRSIEERIDIPEERKDDFRREIMNYIGALALDGKKFDFRTNERLQNALEMKLLDDQKDTIKLTSLVSNAVTVAAQEKIDNVKARLIRDCGYNEESAADVLQYVANSVDRDPLKQAS